MQIYLIFFPEGHYFLDIQYIADQGAGVGGATFVTWKPLSPGLCQVAEIIQFYILQYLFIMFLYLIEKFVADQISYQTKPPLLLFLLTFRLTFHRHNILQTKCFIDISLTWISNNNQVGSVLISDGSRLLDQESRYFQHLRGQQHYNGHNNLEFEYFFEKDFFQFSTLQIGKQSRILYITLFSGVCFLSDHRCNHNICLQFSGLQGNQIILKVLNQSNIFFIHIWN